MPRADSLRGSRRRHITFLFTAALVIATDQLSKLWIRTNLLLGQSLPQEGLLRLTYVRNTGGVFGLQAPQALWLLFPTLLIIVAFLLYYRYLRFHYLSVGIAAAMLLGGGMGNLIERLFSGGVTDFIDLRLWGGFHWPTFNLADCAIVIGVVLLGYLLLFQRKQLKLG